MSGGHFCLIRTVDILFSSQGKYCLSIVTGQFLREILVPFSSRGAHYLKGATAKLITFCDMGSGNRVWYSLAPDPA